MRQLLDYDPINGVSCYFNAEGEKFFFTHEQDTRLILDGNVGLQNNDSYTKKGIKEDFWHYATIPTVVEMEWLNKYGVSLDNPDHKKKVFELLNHPDYRNLKTTSKKHTVRG